MFGTTLFITASSIFAISFAAPHRVHVDTSDSLVARDDYIMFGGDGSMAAGWPKRSEWMPFEKAWDASFKVIQTSCEYNGWGKNNDETEMKAIKDSIGKESDASGIPNELILAVVVQESKGCVRAPTTRYEFENPGLMQSAGKASCNSDLNGKAPISPCPATTIRAMIHDGTAGEGLRTTLKNSLDFFDPTGTADDSKWYKAARRYNAGSSMNQGNLGLGPSPCYASDIANRLLRPFGDSTCKADVITTLTNAQGRISSSDTKNDQPIENKEKHVEDKESSPEPKDAAPEHSDNVTPQKDSAVDNSNTNNKSQGSSTNSPDPIIAGAANGCTKYFTPQKGHTCASVPIDFARLRQLNSQLNDKCTNLWAGYQYCIAV